MFITAVRVIFLIKLRWPKTKSLYDTVFERYGQTTLKVVRDFEKDLSRFNKASLDIGFLRKCKMFHIFPTFLSFKLSKEEFHDTRACRRFKEDLLNYEINQKFYLRCRFKKSYESVRSSFKSVLSPLDSLRAGSHLGAHARSFREESGDKGQRLTSVNFSFLLLLSEVKYHWSKSGEGDNCQSIMFHGKRLDPQGVGNLPRVQQLAWPGARRTILCVYS